MFCLFFSFWPRCMWNLGSRTSDWTHTLCIGRRSQLLDSQGSPRKAHLFKPDLLPLFLVRHLLVWKWSRPSGWTKSGHWDSQGSPQTGEAQTGTQPLRSQVKVKVSQSCPTLWNPMDCAVHGILKLSTWIKEHAEKWAHILFNLQDVCWSQSRRNEKPRSQINARAQRLRGSAEGVAVSWRSGPTREEGHPAKKSPRLSNETLYSTWGLRTNQIRPGLKKVETWPRMIPISLYWTELPSPLTHKIAFVFLTSLLLGLLNIQERSIPKVLLCWITFYLLGKMRPLFNRQ